MASQWALGINLPLLPWCGGSKCISQHLVSVHSSPRNQSPVLEGKLFLAVLPPRLFCFLNTRVIFVLKPSVSTYPRNDELWNNECHRVPFPPTRHNSLCNDPFHLPSSGGGPSWVYFGFSRELVENLGMQLPRSWATQEWEITHWKSPKMNYP